MAIFSTSTYFKILLFLILYFKALSAAPNSSFNFKNFGKNSKFESKLALYGNAKVINGSSSVQVTGSSIFSAGRVMYKKPIKFLETNPRNIMSFSTHFSFSLSHENGDGLAFVMVPIEYPLNDFDDGASFGLFGWRKFKVLGVEFDTFMDDKDGDVNSNHVGIDISSPVSVKVSNVSSVKMVLNSGEKMQAWIDYEPGFLRLEVRLGQLGEMRPVNPLLSYRIDLSRMWKDKELFVGLSSSSRNSLQKCKVYSWSMKLTRVPHWMHSQPLDPKAFSGPVKIKDPVDNKRDCLPRILAALILGIGCGGFGAFIVLFVWTIFDKRQPVVPEECAVKPVEFEYKKFKVVVDKSAEDGNK